MKYQGVFDDEEDHEEEGPAQPALPLPPPAAGSYLEEVFGPGGYLAQAAGPAYETRPGQIALAKLVDRVIQGETHALAEGPCGTGKGLAYLVPAIRHASHGGKTVVIATANLALQDQLLEKDLPALAAALPWAFKYRGLKGRSNYFCAHKAAETEGNGLLRPAHELFAWGRSTERGDKKELPVVPSDETWSLVSTTSEECLGDGCDYYPEGCHYEREKRAAREAGIVVTNLHVLGAHLSLRQQTGLDLILPPFDVCIIDEAHELPGAMREFFGFTLTQRNVDRLARTIRSVLGSEKGTTRSAGVLADSLERAAYHFFGEVANFARPKGRVRLVNAAGFCDANPLLQALGNVEAAAARTEQDELEHMERMNVATGNGGNTQRGKLAARLKDRAGRMIAHVSEAVAQADPGNHVYWVDFHQKDIRRNHPRIEARPLKVGGILNGELFKLCPTVVLVSATLTTTPGDFSFIRSETGIPSTALELAVPSPFDLERACIAILPEGLPEGRPGAQAHASLGPPPASPGSLRGRKRSAYPLPATDDKDFARKLVPFYEYVLDVCDGRTLGLFTSYRNLEAVVEEVADGSRHPILVQERGGGMSRGELVRRFKSDTHSSLFGTDSFWTGIDVVGEALVAVIIDKLPFEHQDDPLIAATKDQKEDEFWAWYTNRAIIKLRQGVGRLIRSQDDVGVIVILDERIKTKRYGLMMARALGPMSKGRDLSTIESFLACAHASVMRNRQAFQEAQRRIPMEPVCPKPKSRMSVPKGAF